MTAVPGTGSASRAPRSPAALLAAPAARDAAVLADHGRPVLRPHVTDTTAPTRLAALVAAGEEIA
ncbi:hypothetical protein [uncultured Cellulomonas sp.]|uniref:hypothetical protein n=1 Tax=uncultured Cellulomonas sp. TaxID=189682 RepID=UPI002628311D|nr:hypothetical protein [uncultured Cellulomonas sp.]